MPGVVFNINSVVLISGLGVEIPEYPTPPDLGYDDIVDESMLPVRRIPPVKIIKLQYARNWTPMPDGLAGAVRETTPELAAKLEKEYSQVEEVNALLTSDPDAVTINPPTLIVNEADAIIEADRRLALSAAVRNVYQFKTFAAPFTMELSQSVTIEYPQYFAGGASAVISRLIDQLNSDQCQIEVVK